jgi:hypothetical protein
MPGLAEICDVDDVERVARCRLLQGLCRAYVGPSAHQMVETLRRAERDPSELQEAIALFATLPTRQRRNILASFAAVLQPGRSRSSELDRGLQHLLSMSNQPR